MKINWKRHKAHWKTCTMTTNWHNGPKDTQKHCWNKIIPVIFTEMQDDLSESWQKQTDNNKNTNFPKIRFKIITDEKMLWRDKHWKIKNTDWLYSDKSLKTAEKWNEMTTKRGTLTEKQHKHRESDQLNKNENDRWMTINSYEEMTKADKQLKKKSPHKPKYKVHWLQILK